MNSTDAMQEVADIYLNSHPHPIFYISEDYRILAFNPAARRHFPSMEVGMPCHSIYGEGAECPTCCRAVLNAGRDYSERRRFVPAMKCDCFITARTTLRSGTRAGYVEVIHPIPLYMQRLATLHEFILNIDSLDSTLAVGESLCRMVAAFGFRSRLWEYHNALGSETLRCVAVIPEGSVPEAGLFGKELPGADALFASSFQALRKKRMIYVTSSNYIREYFAKSFGGDSVRGEADVIDANPAVFPDLSLRFLRPHEKYVPFVPGAPPHDWLDIPLGGDSPALLLGKVSVSPLTETGRFTRDDMELFWLASRAANARLFRLAVHAAEFRRGYLEATHETRHAHQSALSGIEVLRARAGTDESGEYGNRYILRNLEDSIRLMTFLNEYPNLEDPRGNYSKDAINLHKDVIAPMVNLIRHWFLNDLLARNIIAFPKDYAAHERPRDLRSFDELAVHFGKGHFEDLFAQMNFLGLSEQYSICYAKGIESLRFYINPYRLQCVFYNLLSNALKYRLPDKVAIVIRAVRSPAELHLSRVDLGAYTVIRVSDEGCGIEEHEVDKIFEPSRRGSAAEKTREAGYGKGLFVARTIMRTLGGDLRVDSLRSPTAFDVIIPRRAASPAWLRMDNAR
jgi:signal transduction histidine kinase